MDAQHNSDSPYRAADPYYSKPSGFNESSERVKKPINKWIKFGIPVLILLIVGLIVGVVVGVRKGTSRSSSGAASAGGSGDTTASSAVSAKLAIGRFATATDSEYMVPLYPSTVSPHTPFSFLWPDEYIRQTLPFLRRLPSLVQPVPRQHGLKIRSNRVTLMFSLHVQIVHASLHPLINGKHFPLSFRMIPTSRVGMILSLEMPQTTLDYHLLFTSWMAIVVFWTTHEMSR